MSTIVFGYLYGGLFIIGLLLLFLNNNLTVNKVGYTCLYITFLILLAFIKEIQKAQDWINYLNNLLVNFKMA